MNKFKIFNAILMLTISAMLVVSSVPVMGSKNWLQMGEKSFSIQLDEDKSWCMDQQWNKGEVGYKIWLWLCSAGPAQTFRVKNGKIEHIDSGLCMAFKGTPGEVGLPIIIDKCKNAQKFKMIKDLVSKKYYIVLTDKTELYQDTYCLDLQYNDIKKGATIWLFKCNYSKSQNWIKVPPTSIINPEV
jgi:Ricin-type beta-trefoil lectin domain